MFMDAPIVGEPRSIEGPVANTRPVACSSDDDSWGLTKALAP